MTCYAKKNLINHALSPKCAQNFEDKERKKHISNLIRFFHFFNFCFLVESHYPDRLLFKQTFFIKKLLFLSFLVRYIFYQQLFIPNMSVFFANFQSPKNIIFLKKMNKTFIFSFFIQNKTSSYFEKKTE